jgi:3-oxo-5-alpha-steroid 4-dehydrogenase 3 / polyprenol reductase
MFLNFLCNGVKVVQVLNLVIAAAETQKWYHAKFEDYPRSRKALLPLIW